MISVFPSFEKLSILHKKDIETLTAPFPPYSDFNFCSLWSWNTENKIIISTLNNNLVVKFQDYVTNEYFLSFIGKNEVEETIKTLLNYSTQNKLPSYLKLLPESNFTQAELNRVNKVYMLKEDQDNYDYILSSSEIASMSGRKLHHKRKLLNHFLKEHKYTVHIKSLIDKNVQREVLDFFTLWRNLRNRTKEETSNELLAIERMLSEINHFDLTLICLYSRNQFIGYTIFETAENGYIVSDFQKGDLRYKGIYEVLNWELAKYALQNNSQYINIEQDLGIPGLRRAKQDYNPTFLKKFIIAFT